MNNHNSDNAPLNISAAWDMLSYVPAEDRDDWISIGMSLKAEFSDAGFSLFDGWSETASNYSARAAKDVWRSFKGNGRSIGTLIHIAKQNGYRQGREAAPRSMPEPRKAPARSHSTESYAKELFLACSQDNDEVASHPYARVKDIEWAAGCGRGIASGKVIGQNADCLIIPVRNMETNKVSGVQCINADGLKQNFGRLTNGALLLGNTLNKKDIWFVAEGFASAVSVVCHLNKNVGICSFGKSNLENVARKVDAFYHPAEIIILYEVD